MNSLWAEPIANKRLPQRQRKGDGLNFAKTGAMGGEVIVNQPPPCAKTLFPENLGGGIFTPSTPPTSTP
jgi:hypothetical protein